MDPIQYAHPYIQMSAWHGTEIFQSLPGEWIEIYEPARFLVTQ